MTFLPEDYTAPSSSANYMKLQPGENKIRILSTPLLGWIDWTEEKKPVRFRYKDKPLNSINPKQPVRHFWAMIVWNYELKMIQVLEITQATLRSKIETLCKDKDWGAPYFYDLKIIKTGQQKETSYDINPLPHKKLDPAIEEEFYTRRCWLDALFVGEDPFAPQWPTSTKGIFDMEDMTTVPLVKIDEKKTEQKQQKCA